MKVLVKMVMAVQWRVGHGMVAVGGAVVRWVANGWRLDSYPQYCVCCPDDQPIAASGGEHQLSSGDHAEWRLGAAQQSR